MSQQELLISLGDTVIITAVSPSVPDKRIGFVSKLDKQKVVGNLRRITARYEELKEDRILDPYDETLLGSTTENMLEGLVKDLRRVGIGSRETERILVDFFTKDTDSPMEPEFARDKAQAFVGLLSRLGESIPRDRK